MLVFFIETVFVCVCLLVKRGHITQVCLVCDGEMAAIVHRGAERQLSLCQKKLFLPSPFAHQPTEAQACQRPPLCCLGDLFSHTGDMALQQQQHACVGGYLKCHYSLLSSQEAITSGT